MLFRSLGALLFPVGRIGHVEWAILGSGLGMTAGLGLVALRVLGMSAGEWGRAGEVGGTGAAQASRASDGRMAEA